METKPSIFFPCWIGYKNGETKKSWSMTIIHTYSKKEKYLEIIKNSQERTTMYIFVNN